MAVEFAREKDFSARVLKAERPVLVSFRANWCAQSVELAKVVEAASDRLGDRIDVIAVDVGDDVRAHRVCQQFKITRLPVTMLFDEGRAVDFIGGMTTVDGLVGMVEPRLAAVREVTDIDFEREVLGSRLPVLVHVDSAACRFSVPLGDIVESVASKYKDRAKAVRLDFDGQTAQVRARYGFNRVPVVAMFRGGELVDQIYGGISDDARSNKAQMRSERSSRLRGISEMVEQFA